MVPPLAAVALFLTAGAGEAATRRTLAVILFNFANDDRQPLPPEEVHRRVFTDPTSTRAFYREQSFGLVDLVGKVDPEGDVFGWYTVALFNRPCDRDAWAAAALAAAAAQGVDGRGYDHLALLFPDTDSCPFLGYGEQPGRIIWVNGASAATLTHELGHNLGMAHASARLCRDAQGRRVALGTSCTDVEYGNPFDVMGGGFRHTNAYNKAEAHWLDGGDIAEAAASGVYQLHDQERRTPGLHLLALRRDASSFYYLEYRQPLGFDAAPLDPPVPAGVQVLIGGPRGAGTPTFLLDVAPETATLADAALGPGGSYRDPAASLTITVREISAEAATVEIERGGGCATAGRGRPGPLALLVVAVSLWRRRLVRGVA
jgi:hypothetical protein